MIKICAYCGKEFNDRNSKYCSENCAKLAEEKRKLEYSRTKTRICKRCGKEFIVPKLANGKDSHRLYCSDACANNVIVNKESEKYQPMKKCKICGKLFNVPRYDNGLFKNDVKYCSESCKQKAEEERKLKYQQNKTRICKQCGKEFIVPRISDGHFSETVFCSDECRYYGRIISQKKEAFDEILYITSNIIDNKLENLVRKGEFIYDE